MQKPQLFKRALGENAYSTLPTAIQAFHENADKKWHGSAKITGDNNVILRILRKLNGLPAINPKVPVTISVHYQQDQEIWQRQFGDAHFTSTMGINAAKGLLYEKVGLLRFYFRPHIRPLSKDNPQLTSHWDFQYVTILGIKIPRAISPTFIARESVSTNHIYQFKAHVRLPLLGVLVDYEGELYPPNSGDIA